jgi:CheY-like chemotaxis protein/HPt (histidine-containing phosphotransfer) domain-containing protein
MRPTTVESGAAAWAALEQAAETKDRFALILLDVMMPGMDGFTLVERIRLLPRPPGGPDWANIPIIMLTAAGRKEDLARCQTLEVAGCLTKPVKQADLFDAIVKALRISIQRASQSTSPREGEAPAEPFEGAARQGTPAYPPRPPGGRGVRSLKILLAEDNVVNQRLAVRLLTKRGHDVVVVTTGREVLAALEQHLFDLLLMDVQMPELGGLETASLIREKEQGTSRHIPIIAITAHALKGDRERCLAAGMDGYISKPIRSSELFRTIADLVGAEPVNSGQGAASSGQQKQGQEESENVSSPRETEDRGSRIEDRESSTAPVSSSILDPPFSILDAPTPLSAQGPLPKEVWNKERALARLDNDLDFLGEIVQLFLEDCPVRMAEIRDAIARGDALLLQRAAHTLKGALSNLEAPAAYRAAVQFEATTKEENGAKVQAAYTKLEEAIHALEPALRL